MRAPSTAILAAALALLLSLSLSLSGCGGTEQSAVTPPVVTPTVTSLTIAPAVSTIAIGASVQLVATPRDATGRAVSTAISWTSRTPSVATVSPAGAVVGLSAGSTEITATAGAVTATTTVAVSATSAYFAGQSYFGRSNYVEYVAGNAPVILTAPHGGALTPTSIPDRTAAACGGSATTVTDANTIELVRAMQARFFARFGAYPHVVISHLSRRKLDPNRLQPEAACGNVDAAVALVDWHAFIDVAKAAILQSAGKGWYMDMHGHGHTIQRLELGYLLADTDLDRSDATLDASTSFENTSSIRTLSQFATLSFSALLRGPASLGTLYANNGFPAVPSASDPRVNGTDYFNGGDNTRRHSCGADASPLGGTTNGNICGVQIEANFVGVRDNSANRDRFGNVTAIVLEEYLRTHWGLHLAPP